MRVLLPILLSMIMLSGCATLGGDMIVRVTGQLPQSAFSTERTMECQLSMLARESGTVVSSRQISSTFSTTMMVVVGPSPDHYYFIAECVDGSKFRSGDIALSSRRSYGREFDLGVLVEDAR